MHLLQHILGLLLQLCQRHILSVAIFGVDAGAVGGLQTSTYFLNCCKRKKNRIVHGGKMLTGRPIWESYLKTGGYCKDLCDYFKPDEQCFLNFWLSAICASGTSCNTSMLFCFSYSQSRVQQFLMPSTRVPGSRSFGQFTQQSQRNDGSVGYIGDEERQAALKGL